MSWLSSLFGGDDKKERQRAEQARTQREQSEATRIAEERRVAQEAAARAEQERLAGVERQKQERAQKRTDFLGKTSGYAGEKMKATGLEDTYGLGSYFQNLLNTRAAGLGDDADLSTAIDPETLYATAYNDVREGARRKATSRVNELAPEGYGKAQFADTADDAILDSILNTQYGSAREAVERAKSRGQLNEAGYTAAGSDLETTRGTARTKLEDAGLGVLSRYRSDLDTELGTVRDRARNLDLGENLNIDALIGGVGQKAAGYRGRMEGDVRSATQGMDFFDISNLLGRAGSGQGFSNPGKVGGPLVNAFASADKKGDLERDRASKRGTGNVGAF